MGLPEGDSKERALRELTELLTKERVPYALIGGVAIQIYSEEPRTTQDLDIALASYDDLPREQLKAAGFKHERTFDHSDNWRAPGSEPKKQRTPIQFSVDKLTPGTVERAESFRVRGLHIKVASLPDLVRLKLEAAEDPRRRPTRRMSDITDTQRLLYEHPEIAREVPDAFERLGKLLDRAAWELHWRKYGVPEMNEEAARQWWLTPGPTPRDLTVFMQAAPEAVRAVIDRQGLPLSWR